MLKQLTPIEKEYLFRINKALDFIENNLEKPLKIEEIALEANFSKFHFHRIFQGMLGETPFQFLSRVRLERAAIMLVNQPCLSLSQISTKCGFSDLSIFSRKFKKHFGLSATDYKNSKNSQSESKKLQAGGRSITYLYSSSQQIKWKLNMEQNLSVEVQQLPKMTVAYVRHIGPHKGDSKLFERLMHKLLAWAGPRNLAGKPDSKVVFIYHDDPSITSEAQQRVSVCMTVPEDTEVSGDVGKMEVQGGKHAIGHFVLSASEFEEAWQWMYGNWLPNSGYQPAERPPFEMYPEEGNNGKFKVDICIPLQPL